MSSDELKAELRTLRRKITLKLQAIKLFRLEIRDMRTRLSLLRIRDDLLQQINPEFDSELSRKLDCLDFLLRESAPNEGHRSESLQG
jgi:hypothetical protein